LIFFQAFWRKNNKDAIEPQMLALSPISRKYKPMNLGLPAKRRRMVLSTKRNRLQENLKHKIKGLNGQRNSPKKKNLSVELRRKLTLTRNICC